ncbi:helix-turn-helix domain-containing protein [Geodermatophilus sp. URMC 62]|uniref:helix-turn-helix domain-containing protein n=1 Tax=Geodermatophilus sp. URMC 62 TaxID=3423414 RepID=UPI00406D1D18
MQAARRDVLVHVGENLRRLRQAAGLSQSTLAEASGLSRRTIINLEAGEANVSLSGLDRLADALGATFVDLVRPPAASSRDIGAVAWRGSAPESEAVLLGSVPARSEAQLWSWVLGAGERYDAEPDPAGWHEMVVATAGRLRIERDEGPVELAPGDHAVYSSAQRYAYVNVHDGVTRFVRTVVS